MTPELMGLRLVKLTAGAFSEVDPWYRVIDPETDRVVGSGETPEAARADAERQVRRARERHRPGRV